MSPEKGPFQKEITSFNHQFSGDMLVFRGVGPLLKWRFRLMISGRPFLLEKNDDVFWGKNGTMQMKNHFTNFSDKSQCHYPLIHFHLTQLFPIPSQPHFVTLNGPRFSPIPPGRDGKCHGLLPGWGIGVSNANLHPPKTNSSPPENGWLEDDNFI